MGKKNFFELFRYGVVGLGHNALGYALFLLLTWLGMTPVAAVGVLYPASALVNFTLNKHWTFRSKGGKLPAELARFVLAHLFAYGANLGLLHLFADVLGFPYQFVQLVLIFVIAGFLFLLFKYFVLALETE